MALLPVCSCAVYQDETSYDRSYPDADRIYGLSVTTIVWEVRKGTDFRHRWKSAEGGFPEVEISGS